MSEIKRSAQTLQLAQPWPFLLSVIPGRGIVKNIQPVKAIQRKPLKIKVARRPITGKL